MSWISQQLDGIIQREAVERAVSTCGHVVIDGKCHELLKGRLTRHDLENQLNEEAVKERLAELGFNLSLPIEREEDTFTGAFTFCQLRPVRCGPKRAQFDLKTVEGLRAWMRAGCPTG